MLLVCSVVILTSGNHFSLEKCRILRFRELMLSVEKYGNDDRNLYKNGTKYIVVFKALNNLQPVAYNFCF